MPYYESVYIARQDISAQQVETVTQDLTTVVENNGGRIAKSEYWGLRGLAYRVKKNRKGHYVLMHIDGPAAAIHEMERNMRINEDVIRYLTVKVDKLEEGPSAMMQSRGGRDDRRDDRRGGRDSSSRPSHPSNDRKSGEK